jgi:hypothetical protein
MRPKPWTKPWTDEELTFLRENWGKLPRAELARRLNRSIPSINDKAGTLGLRRKKELRWTPEDITFLRENWGKLSICQLAKKLNRTKHGILVKSKRLKLGPVQDRSCFNKREICGLLGVDHRKVDRWIQAGLLKAKVAKTGRERGKCRGIIEVKPREFLRFLRENQNLWDTRTAGDIIKAVREKEWLAEKIKVRREEGKVRREIPWHLKTAFMEFVAEVATGAVKRIRAARQEPGWLRKKRELDQAKYLVRRWTPEEDEALRRLFRNQELSYSEIGQMLSKTRGAIGHRLARIDVWENDDRKAIRQ